MVPLQQDCSAFDGVEIEVFDQGEKVTIQRVIGYSTIGGEIIIALGRIRGIEFEYYYGGRQYLAHAPWEKGEYDPNRCLCTNW